MAAAKKTWILISDASRARLFVEATPGRPYALVASFEHPEGRLHTSELVSDAVGRKPVGGSRGDGVNGRPGGFYGRPGVEPDTDPKDIQALKFARDLAETLERGLDDHAYEVLVVAAPPRFLGVMREVIGERVRRTLACTLDKDLSLLPPREIERRVREARAA